MRHRLTYAALALLVLSSCGHDTGTAAGVRGLVQDPESGFSASSEAGGRIYQARYLPPELSAMEAGGNLAEYRGLVSLSVRVPKKADDPAVPEGSLNCTALLRLASGAELQCVDMIHEGSAPTQHRTFLLYFKRPAQGASGPATLTFNDTYLGGGPVEFQIQLVDSLAQIQ